MLRILWLVPALLVALISGAVECNAAPKLLRSTPGAFLPYRSDSVETLVKQIESNKSAAERYARHYGVSSESVMKYFRENLILTTIKKPMLSTVFFLTKSGRVQSSKRILPTGNRVFATRDGIPLLDWRCSNPVTTYLPIRKVKVQVKSAALSTTDQVVTAVKPQPPMEIVQPGITALAMTPEVVAAPIVASVVPEISAIPSISIPTSVMAAVIPALAGAYAIRSDSPSPVPEPASLAGLGFGVMGAALQLCRCRRRK